MVTTKLGRLLTLSTVVSIAIVMALVSPAAIASSAKVAPHAKVGSASTLVLTKLGVVNLSEAARASSASKFVERQAKQTPLRLTPAQRAFVRSVTNTSTSGTSASSLPHTGNLPGERGFTGLTAPENAAVNPAIGDVTPPDQGLAVGPSPAGTAVVEFLNQVLAVFSPSGKTLLGAIPAYQVFGLAPTAFLSDPRAYYDTSTQRWFFTMFTFGTATSPKSTQYIAVSQTSDGFGNYSVFSINTTDAHQPGCPCFGDYDQFGADQNGIYIATNEFSNTGPAFNGAVIYAVSKKGIEKAASGTGPNPSVIRYRIPTDVFGQAYHVSPASTPPGGTYAPGTEYFVESNSDANTDNRLEVYALTGTQLLNTGGMPTFTSTTVHTERYSFPPNATQKIGPTPLGTSEGYTEGVLSTDFNAVQEVTYTAGNLYAELDTARPFKTGFNSGVAWFILTPSLSPARLSVNVDKQGFVDTTQNLLYPVIAVNATGSGYLAYAISGPNYYPSAAYSTFSSNGPGSTMYIAAKGANPLDDFSCYPPFSSGQCRYGDYSMGVAYGNSIYMATEYVPPTPRDNQTDYGTFVWSAPAS